VFLLTSLSLGNVIVLGSEGSVKELLNKFIVTTSQDTESLDNIGKVTANVVTGNINVILITGKLPIVD
ncbi:hypothetical protein PpSQ1_27310, partial [Pseudomonas putida]